MQATEKQLTMAVQLYDMHERARSLLKGERYKLHMVDLGTFLKMTAERDKKDVLSVATEVCTKRALLGMEQMMVMAAAVELTEPTP